MLTLLAPARAARNPAVVGQGVMSGKGSPFKPNRGKSGMPADERALFEILEQFPYVYGSLRRHFPCFCKSARAAASCAAVVFRIQILVFRRGASLCKYLWRLEPHGVLLPKL